MAEQETIAQEAAFGHAAENGHCCGLSKREHFAALMMQALIANPERYKYIADQFNLGEVDQEGASAKNAHKAVKLADALIAELNK